MKKYKYDTAKEIFEATNPDAESRRVLVTILWFKIARQILLFACTIILFIVLSYHVCPDVLTGISGIGLVNLIAPMKKLSYRFKQSEGENGL